MVLRLQQPTKRKFQPIIPYTSTTPNAFDTPITGSSSPSDIQLRIRVSHLFWDTVWMDATITYYDEHSPTPTEQKHQQAWVNRENFTFRVESGKVDEKPTFFQVCDGETIIRYNSQSANLESTPLPPYCKKSFQSLDG